MKKTAMRRTRDGLRAVAIHNNGNVRKLCGCAWGRWSECKHPWHFNYKPSNPARRNPETKDGGYRFSLDRVLGKHLDSKTEAAREAKKLQVAIDEGTFRQVLSQPSQPVRETLTLAALMEQYRKAHLAVHRKATLKTLDYMIAAIMGTLLERADGERRYFGAWLVADITTDVIEQYRRARLPFGAVGTNRHLELLRGMFFWATSSKRKLAAENPFLDGTKPALEMSEELPRSRRLQAGEAERLLAACGPHLRAVVEAALECGCRRGELLSLQWWQVRFAPKAEIFLPAAKTKTRRDRSVPISSRLKAILDMRRNSPDGQELPPQAYVFGNEVGEPIANVKRAWERAVLKAHGHKPAYIKREQGEGRKPKRTAALTPESREQLRAINLHFHDLRRECGSRWLDAAVPLHRIQGWLGHSNISQTSTYLKADAADDDQEMRRYEERRAALQQLATSPGTAGQTGAQTAAMGESRAQKGAEIRH